MLRVLFAVLLPLVLPTVVYVLWRTFAPPKLGGSTAIHRGGWEDMPWPWLAIAGVVLLAVMLGYIAVASGAGIASGSASAPAGSN